jgi:hypothetical protein
VFPVGGRLRFFLGEWEGLGLSPWHRKILLHGLHLSFTHIPPMSSTPRPIILPRNSIKAQVLIQEVQSLLQKKALEEVTDNSPGFYSHVFTVPKKSGGFRPVIDLKILNSFIRCPKFKMESDRSIREQLRQGEWTTSIDFTDAYLHIPIWEHHKSFLRLHIQGRSFQFTAMCFGLNIAPRVFTKLLEPVASHLRTRGILVHRYLDDWLIRGPSKSIVQDHTSYALQLFNKLGLLVNLKKSELEPRTKFVFLGMDLDLELAWVRPTEDEVQKILQLCSLLKRMSKAPVRLLLSLLGLFNHTSQFLQLGRLHLRPLQFYVKAKVQDLRRDIDCKISLEGPFFSALDWWDNYNKLRRGVPLHQPHYQLTLVTDASQEGWGAFLEDHRVSGRWSPREKDLHVSLLELRAVRLALQALQHVVCQKAVRVLSDNVAAVAYIRNQGGTRSISLFKEVWDLLRWTADQEVVLIPFYLPGHLNSLADLLSRKTQVLSTEWTLHQAIFKRIHQLVPQLNVDLFATRMNNQLPMFVSPCPDPLAWAVDAFALDWEDFVAYAYPPVKLIPEILKKVRQSTAQVFLVAPHWPNQSWFPDLLSLLFDLPLQIPPWRHLLRQPHLDVFHSSPHHLHLHVWPLSGENSERQDFLRRLRNMQPPHSVTHLYACTNLIGSHLPIGALKEMWIHPLQLYRKSETS